MAGLYVRTGGVWQQAGASTAVHAAGAWQPLQQGWVRVSGTWQQFFSASLSGNVTVVNNVYAAGYVGYGTASWGTAGGSITASSFRGYTITLISVGGGNSGYCGISGFSSDPLVSFFTSLTVNSVMRLTSSLGGGSYIYSGGKAEWIWGSGTDFFTSAGTYAFTIT